MGDETGLWYVAQIETMVGESIVDVSRLEVISGSISELATGTVWKFEGIRSNERYTIRNEQNSL